MPGFKLGIKLPHNNKEITFAHGVSATPFDVEDLEEELEIIKKEEWEPMDLLSTAIQTIRAVCDGAVTEDAQGFAGMHVHHGHRIAKTFVDFGARGIMPEDIIWMRDHLPYYKNTQLNWVPWEDWGEVCKNSMATALENQEAETKREEAELAREHAFEEQIKKLPYQEARLLFMSIRRQETAERDYNFLTSLQTQRYPHTEKQKIWIYKFLAKYWGAVAREKPFLSEE